MSLQKPIKYQRIEIRNKPAELKRSGGRSNESYCTPRNASCGKAFGRSSLNIARLHRQKSLFLQESALEGMTGDDDEGAGDERMKQRREKRGKRCDASDRPDNVQLREERKVGRHPSDHPSSSRSHLLRSCESEGMKLEQRETSEMKTGRATGRERLELLGGYPSALLHRLEDGAENLSSE